MTPFAHVTVLAAEAVAPPETLPMKVVVCVTHEGAKSVASTDGMLRTMEASPYYESWLSYAVENEAAIHRALLVGNFVLVVLLVVAVGIGGFGVGMLF